MPRHPDRPIGDRTGSGAHDLAPECLLRLDPRNLDHEQAAREHVRTHATDADDEARLLPLLVVVAVVALSATVLAYLTEHPAPWLRDAATAAPLDGWVTQALAEYDAGADRIADRIEHPSARLS